MAQRRWWSDGRGSEWRTLDVLKGELRTLEKNNKFV